MNEERGFGLGLIIGVAVLCLSSALVFFGAQKWAAMRREGWNLVPVVVAAVDIRAGDAVTMEMISQRSIPEQFVTDEMVKPDTASYMVNDVTLVPLQAGDIVLWHGMQAQNTTVVLTRDVAAGALLTAQDVVNDKRVGTVTMVPGANLEAVLNTRTARALKRGDALHFSDLVAPEAR